MKGIGDKKSDLLDKTNLTEVITEDIILNYVEKKQLDGFYKTSALENHNVLKVFKELNNFMFKKQDKPYIVI